MFSEESHKETKMKVCDLLIKDYKKSFWKIENNQKGNILIQRCEWKEVKENGNTIMGAMLIRLENAFISSESL